MNNGKARQRERERKTAPSVNECLWFLLILIAWIGYSGCKDWKHFHPQHTYTHVHSQTQQTNRFTIHPWIHTIFWVFFVVVVVTVFFPIFVPLIVSQIRIYHAIFLSFYYCCCYWFFWLFILWYFSMEGDVLSFKPTHTV